VWKWLVLDRCKWRGATYSPVSLFWHSLSVCTTFCVCISVSSRQSVVSINQSISLYCKIQLWRTICNETNVNNNHSNVVLVHKQTYLNFSCEYPFRTLDSSYHELFVHFVYRVLFVSSLCVFSAIEVCYENALYQFTFDIDNDNIMWPTPSLRIKTLISTKGTSSPWTVRKVHGTKTSVNQSASLMSLSGGWESPRESPAQYYPPLITGTDC